jgi:hypothetical protein
VISGIWADKDQVGGEAGAAAGRVLVEEVASEVELLIGREVVREVEPPTVGEATYEVTRATVI